MGFINYPLVLLFQPFSKASWHTSDRKHKSAPMFRPLPSGHKLRLWPWRCPTEILARNGRTSLVLVFEESVDD